ncbi:MAG: hypothetical protein R2860_10895, partial [Desulfobacterales bacterium]
MVLELAEISDLCWLKTYSLTFCSNTNKDNCGHLYLLGLLFHSHLQNLHIQKIKKAGKCFQAQGERGMAKNIKIKLILLMMVFLCCLLVGCNESSSSSDKTKSADVETTWYRDAD